MATPIVPPSFRWGAQPQDWTTYQETAVRPLYDAVFVYRLHAVTALGFGKGASFSQTSWRF